MKGHNIIQVLSLRLVLRRGWIVEENDVIFGTDLEKLWNITSAAVLFWRLNKKRVTRNFQIFLI